MARSTRKWIQRALGVKVRRVGGKRRKVAAHRGALHRMLGIPRNQKIPLETLKWAAKQPGKLGHRARFALNARRFRHKKRRRG